MNKAPKETYLFSERILVSYIIESFWKKSKGIFMTYSI